MYPPLNFLSMWLSGIITIAIVIVITHPSGRSLSGFSPQLSCQFYSPVFHGFRDKLHDFVGYLIQLKTACYQALWDYTVSSCNQSTPQLHFCVSFCSRWECVDKWIILSCSSVPLQHPFCSSMKSLRFIKE